MTGIYFHNAFNRFCNDCQALIYYIENNIIDLVDINKIITDLCDDIHVRKYCSFQRPCRERDLTHWQVRDTRPPPLQPRCVSYLLSCGYHNLSRRIRLSLKEEPDRQTEDIPDSLAKKAVFFLSNKYVSYKIDRDHWSYYDQALNNAGYTATIAS